jgi:hypothetical protein
MSLVRLMGREALAVHATLTPGEHCRLLIAGPLVAKQESNRELPTELALQICDWTEPSPTCPHCGGPVLSPR